MNLQPMHLQSPATGVGVQLKIEEGGHGLTVTRGEEILLSDHPLALDHSLQEEHFRLQWFAAPVGDGRSTDEAPALKLEVDTKTGTKWCPRIRTERLTLYHRHPQLRWYSREFDELTPRAYRQRPSAFQHAKSKLLMFLVVPKQVLILSEGDTELARYSLTRDEGQTWPKRRVKNGFLLEVYNGAQLLKLDTGGVFLEVFQDNRRNYLKSREFQELPADEVQALLAEHLAEIPIGA